VVTLVKSEGLSLAWTGGSGTLQFSLSNGTDSPLTCLFDAAAGKGMVPADALTHVTPGISSFSIITLAGDRVIAGAWAVDVEAAYSATWADTRIASGAIMVQ
jgi:hypothetical protein